MDPERLRTTFVLYGAMNRRDWREVTVDDVRFDAKELQNRLIPVIAANMAGELTDAARWAQQLAAECRDALSMLLPFSDSEREFLDRILDHGEIRADILGLDQRLSELVQQHPALLWKAHNVRDRTI